jgi:RimJ/RimL family protein N-acetyltransferase
MVPEADVISTPDTPMTRSDYSLTTERFTLRPLSAADAPAMAALGADPEVVKTLVLDWSTPEKRLAIAEDWIAKASGWDANGYGMWGVFDARGLFGESGRMVGVCCADEPLPKGGEGPEIYYLFSRDTWGRGVASEVTQAVVHYLLADLGLGAVEALIDPGLNPASVRLAEKLGMTLAGRYSRADYEADGARETIRFQLWRAATSAPDLARPNLEDAALKIGQFVAAGLETEEGAAAALRDAADKNGLAVQLGDEAIRDLIRTALRSGMAETGFLHYRVTRTALLAALAARV